MLEILISLIIFNIILIHINSRYKRGENVISFWHFWIIIAMFIGYATYGLHYGDFYRYEDDIKYYGQGNFWMAVTAQSAMEPIYYYLAYLVSGDPIMWRFILYGVQFVILGFWIYKSKMNTYPMMLCFVIICLCNSSGGRMHVGVIMYFAGLYLCINQRNPLYLIISALAYFTHSANAILLAITPVIFFKLTKNRAIIILVFFSFILSVAQNYFNELLGVGGLGFDDHLDDKILVYSDSNYSSQLWGNSVGEFIRSSLDHLPKYIFYIYYFYHFLFNNNFRNKLNKADIALTNILFTLIIISTIFFIGDFGSGTFYYRTFLMMDIPMFVLFLKTFAQGCNNQVGSPISFPVRKKIYKNILIILVLSTEVTYLISLYYFK